jgi:hypothetical protein
VFSTYLYTGNGSTQTITNGIDLAGEGGLVWIKSRSHSYPHNLYDTERGATKRLKSASTVAESTLSTGLTAFSSTGFTLGGDNDTNGTYSDAQYASWTFRKAPKFFDVVTYTGNGVAGRTVSHNLNSVPGCIIVKATNNARSWAVYHRGTDSTAPEDYGLYLNETTDRSDDAQLWNDTAPTSTEFTVGTDGDTNVSGRTYVAYLFAHNNNDGEFGPDGDADIIKCGSVSYPASGDVEVNLGFEPQWVLYKDVNHGGNVWWILDTMRGWNAQETSGTFSSTTGGKAEALFPNTSGAEVEYDYGALTSTGFKLPSNFNYGDNNTDYIYIAIRRGPMAVPESGTDILNIGTRNESGNAPPMYHAGRVVDMAWQREVTTSNNPTMASRLTGNNFLRAYDPSTLTSSSQHAFDYSDGWYNNTETNTNAYSYMFSRAVGAFDVVAYTGNGTSGNGIQHGLGVAPEFIMIHSYGNRNWQIGSQLLDNQAYGYTESSYMYQNGAGNSIFPNTSHTSTHFYVGSDSDVNNNNEKYIAHLWASVDGVIKCGVYTGNGSNSRDIDCGFTSGARFVLLGNCDDSDYSRILFDTDRGITTGAGDNPLSFFYPIPVGYVNSPSGYADLSTTDFIDPISSGFRIKSSSGHTNASGKKYLYMAIA